MTRSWLATGAALLALALAGCDRLPGGWPDTSPVALEARSVLDALARGDVDTVTARLDAARRTPEQRDQLRGLAGEFPKAPPRRVHVVRFNQQRVTETDGATTESSAVTFESNYAEANLLSQVVFVRTDGGELQMIGLHVNPVPAPLEVMNAFTFGGKGPIHYLFLLAMAGAAAVTVVATVVWVRRRKSIRRRWWWLLGILVGAFKISLNWTTGGLDVQALTVQLLSLSYERSGVDGPWVLALSIPAGAIAFLILERKAKSAPTEGSTVAPPAAL